MKTLELYKTEDIDELAWPDATETITEDSPATDVLTDFRKHKPLIIEDSLSATEARKLMQSAHVRMKIVVNAKNHFLGIVSLQDLDGPRMVTKLGEGFTIDELRVTDFMRHRSELKAFSFDEIQQARIGDVVHALQGSGQQHCLVIDRDRHEIRGVISSSDLARKLQLPLDIENKSSFAHVFSVIKESI